MMSTETGWFALGPRLILMKTIQVNLILGLLFNVVGATIWHKSVILGSILFPPFLDKGLKLARLLMDDKQKPQIFEMYYTLTFQCYIEAVYKWIYKYTLSSLYFSISFCFRISAATIKIILVFQQIDVPRLVD